MTWHVDERTAHRYAGRELDPVGSASVEAHLDRCADCRTLVGRAVDEDALHHVWTGIIDVVDRPARSLTESVALRLGCRESTARVLGAVPQAKLAYLFAAVVSALLAVLAANSSQEAAFALYLFIAPLGPLGATAVAFGHWGDPIEPLHATVPMSSLRMLLLRTSASVVPAFVLTALSMPWLADRGWLATTWLLPAFALASATVALASWVRLEVAATWVAVAWVALFAVLRIRSKLPSLVDVLAGPVQILSAVAIAAAVLLTVVRRTAFDYQET